MILSDDEIAVICAESALVTPCDIYYARAIEAKVLEKLVIGIKDYAELIRKLEIIAVDMHWPLMAEAAEAIRELQVDAARYRWLREQHWTDDTLTVTKPDCVKIGGLTYSLERLDQAIDAAIKESK